MGGLQSYRLGPLLCMSAMNDLISKPCHMGGVWSLWLRPTLSFWRRDRIQPITSDFKGQRYHVRKRPCPPAWLTVGGPQEELESQVWALAPQQAMWLYLLMEGVPGFFRVAWPLPLAPAPGQRLGGPHGPTLGSAPRVPSGGRPCPWAAVPRGRFRAPAGAGKQLWRQESSKAPSLQEQCCLQSGLTDRPWRGDGV